jgi:pyruvate dehydrogenase E1 component alpha subunit
MHLVTRDELIAFEADIAEAFNNAQIRAPVHLSGGNEDALIEIFQDIGIDDWVATTWRSHYHCLLKGVPPQRLRADILAGKSITLCYPAQRIVSSAIVGGVIPIALGIAAAIRSSHERVWCFVGDMSALGGAFHEARQFARRNELPITFVIEDNGISVCTPTEAAWGVSQPKSMETLTRRYRYDLPWPHAGAGQRIEF